MPASKKVEVEVEATEEELAESTPKEEKPVWVTEEAETDTVPKDQLPESDPVELETPPTQMAEHSPKTVPESIFGPTSAEPPKSSKKLFWILIVVFTLLGILAGGVGIYLQNRSGGESGTTLPTPSPEVSPEPSPTPLVELDRSDITVQVLNGSGVSGAASKAKDYLEDLGYSVSNIGNADSSDFESTQISLKADAEKYESLLRSDLEEEYTVSSNVEALDEDSDYDVVITLGSE